MAKYLSLVHTSTENDHFYRSLTACKTGPSSRHTTMLSITSTTSPTKLTISRTPWKPYEVSRLRFQWLGFFIDRIDLFLFWNVGGSDKAVDPRVHFCAVNGTLGGPVLRLYKLVTCWLLFSSSSHPTTDLQLAEHYRRATRAGNVRVHQYTRLSCERNVRFGTSFPLLSFLNVSQLHLPKLFKPTHFADDFGSTPQNILAFIAKYHHQVVLSSRKLFFCVRGPHHGWHIFV